MTNVQYTSASWWVKDELRSPPLKLLSYTAIHPPSPYYRKSPNIWWIWIPSRWNSRSNKSLRYNVHIPSSCTGMKPSFWHSSGNWNPLAWRNWFLSTSGSRASIICSSPSQSPFFIDLCMACIRVEFFEWGHHNQQATRYRSFLQVWQHQPYFAILTQ